MLNEVRDLRLTPFYGIEINPQVLFRLVASACERHTKNKINEFPVFYFFAEEENKNLPCPRPNLTSSMGSGNYR